MTPRASRRGAELAKRNFPYGKFCGLLTGAFVTLIGVALQLSPMTILIRASVSAIVIGAIVALGVSLVRIADTEDKKPAAGRGS